ncbi:MAG: hypothetical protein L0H64_00785 [Pseudonocardia sp.]|nr:hypothetical protein [Pseudonocardia sp.]
MFYLHHPSYGTSSETGVAAYRANLELLGQLTGRSEQAAQAQARFDRYVAALREVAPPGAAEITIAPLFGSDDGTYIPTGRENPFCVTLAENELGRCADAHAYQVGEGQTWTDRDDPVWNRLTAVAQGARCTTQATASTAAACGAWSTPCRSTPTTRTGRPRASRHRGRSPPSTRPPARSPRPRDPHRCADGGATRARAAPAQRAARAAAARRRRRRARDRLAAARPR